MPGANYNAGVTSDEYDEWPSSMMKNSKTHRHSSHEHRHSNHSNKDGHHRHSNHSHRPSNHVHGHHHHRKHQDEARNLSLNNDGGVASSPVSANTKQGRPEQQHDATKRSSHRPSSGLAHSTPPETTIMARNSNQTFTQSAPPYSHPIDIDAIAYSSEEEEDENFNIKQSSNAFDKEPLAAPVIAVQTASTDPVSTTTTTNVIHPSTTITSGSVYEPRQGRKCCGCCCDFRRAAIIMNIVIIILEIVAVILVASGYLGSYLYGENTGSNALGKYETIEMIFSAASIVLSGIAIGGAILFNIWWVALNIIWLIVGFILAIVSSLQYCDDYCDWYTDYYDDLSYYDSYCTCSINVASVMVAAAFMIIWIYPHVGFIMEVRNGIMSKETYAREEYSCCCV